MKKLFTGTLAFIVYAVLCLLLYNYLFIDKFESEPIVDKTHEPVNENAINNESSAIIENPISKLDNSLNEELDSIKVLKNDDYQTTNEISDSTQNTTNEIGNNSNTIVTKIEEKAVSIYKASPFIIKDDNGNSLTKCSSFNTIYKNKPKVKIPYACRTYGNDLKELLSNNPNAQILILGYYDGDENNDVGIKRAEYVKKLLINIGIDRDKIFTKDALNNIPFASGIAKGGIDIKLLNTGSTTKTTTIKTPITNSTENINQLNISKGNGSYGYRRFTSGYQGNYFYGNRSFTSYISEISKHLNSNSDKKVYVYGYTDSVGNATDNYNIGKDNVNTAKRLMIQNGIPANKVVAVSKGEKPSGVSGNNRSIIVIVK